ncbi:MAG TPA: hypothetical protein DCS93_30215 [Microscillaceae bacterium]|nr:hypothetical protein [Microscillaceae bacterium]
MKQFLLIGLILLASCETQQQESKQIKSNPTFQQAVTVQRPKADTITIDTSIIALLPSNELFPFEDAQQAPLHLQELKLIESILVEAVQTYNKEREKQFAQYKAKYPEDALNKQQFVINLAEYKRQYVAVVNKQGQKEVWINCFCADGFDWKRAIVTVLDGGKCFFNLKINLAQKKYYDFAVNGSA